MVHWKFDGALNRELPATWSVSEPHHEVAQEFCAAMLGAFPGSLNLYFSRAETCKETKRATTV